jgi:HlyD family secretion protein
MTSSRGPWHDGRGDKRHWPEDRGGNPFGPQGAALLGELRRMPDAFDRELDGGRRVVPPNRGRREDERAKNSDSRKRAASPNRRKGIVRRAVRSWLERLGFNDGISDNRPGKPLAENVRLGTKSDLSVLHRDANVAERAMERTGERFAKNSASNIYELRITERPLQRSGERRFQRDPLGDPPTGPHRQEALARSGQTRKASVNRALGACLERLGSSCSFLVGHVGGPHTADVHGVDLAGRLRHGFQDELRTGLRVLVLGVGIVGGWAVVVPLSAAVTVAGTLVVESDVKKVQHPTGGVIAQILVHDGMHVKEGELVARLNEVQVGANLQVIMKQLDEARMRIARLIAERDGMDEPKIPRELATRTEDKDIEQLIMSENSLFKARARARQSQKELLRGHIGQLGQEIEGLNAQIKSKGTQLDLIAIELRGVQMLYDKQLVPLTRLTSLQREAARLDGEREQLVSTIAETRSKISEAELQILRIDQDLRAEVTKDLRESQDKKSELTERSVAAQDQMNRIDLRAPTSGVVHQLAIHTIGGVIGPAEVIMEIVPDSDNLQVQARLSPKDIDQVLVGQKTLVRLSALNQRTTPQLNGVVSYVSADLSHDKQTDAAYYTLRVTLPGAELRRLGDLQLVSGMPAELFLQTGSRTMMSYLLKPITDQLQRTFSER